MDTAIVFNPKASRNSGLFRKIFGDDSEVLNEDLGQDRGLLAGLEHAVHCKWLINQRRYEEALVFFVKACAASLYCLDELEPVAEKLLTIVDHMEDRNLGRFMQPVHKAVKIMLIGYPLIRTPEDDIDVLFLIKQAADGVHDFHVPLLIHQLTKSDLVWVMSLGAFRTAYRLALDQRTGGEGEGEAFEPCLQLMNHHCRLLQQCRRRHPATLQALVQFRLLVMDYTILQEGLQPSEPLNHDPMCMEEGYTAALEEYGDPAQAMQHLLTGMYASLQGCKGKPDQETKGLLGWAADRIMELVAHMHETMEMWRHAGDKLVASMLMLAHAWPLAQVLDNHTLLSFINKQHRHQQELLLEQDSLSQHTMQPALRQEEQGQEGSSGGASPEKDREEDGGKDADLRCARCQKRIGKQVDKVPCPECQAAFYCGALCQRQHAELHKGACKRAKLKSKLATKTFGE